MFDRLLAPPSFCYNGEMEKHLITARAALHDKQKRTAFFKKSGFFLALFIVPFDRETTP